MENVELGQTVLLSEIVMPEGVKSVDLSQGEENDKAIATVAASRATVESDEPAEGEETEGGDEGEEKKEEGGDDSSSD